MNTKQWASLKSIPVLSGRNKYKWANNILRGTLEKQLVMKTRLQEKQWAEVQKS